MPSFTPARVTLIACTALATAGCVVQPVVYDPPPPPRAAVVVVMDAPPALPIYDQPPCPYDGYHWIPGYWGWGGVGYYWVPGTWVMPPRVGVFWTPGYWGFVAGGRYEFHAGYWGERVGFYGGINYGGGYFGAGFVGGRWEGNAYRYNAAVTNVVNVHNVYHETVINNVTNNITVNNVTRVSYSGGQGGARTERTEDERAAERLPHLQPTDLQVHHERDAAANPALAASQNQGRPPIAATPRPSAFNAPEVTRTRTPTGANPEESPRPEPARRAMMQDRPPEAARTTPSMPPPAQRDTAPVSQVAPQRATPPVAAPQQAARDARRYDPAHPQPQPQPQQKPKQKPKPKPKPQPKRDDRDPRERP